MMNTTDKLILAYSSIGRSKKRWREQLKGDGTDQRVQSLMFMMMIVIYFKRIPSRVFFIFFLQLHALIHAVFNNTTTPHTDKPGAQQPHNTRHRYAGCSTSPQQETQIRPVLNNPTTPETDTPGAQQTHNTRHRYTRCSTSPQHQTQIHPVPNKPTTLDIDTPGTQQPHKTRDRYTRCST